MGRVRPGAPFDVGRPVSGAASAEVGVGAVVVSPAAPLAADRGLRARFGRLVDDAAEADRDPADEPDRDRRPSAAVPGDRAGATPSGISASGPGAAVSGMRAGASTSGVAALSVGVPADSGTPGSRVSTSAAGIAVPADCAVLAVPAEGADAAVSTEESAVAVPGLGAVTWVEGRGVAVSSGAT
ncbi:hypothetical protein DKT69_31140, partial [Micromonospora sicca]